MEPNNNFFEEVKEMVDNYVEYLASMGFQLDDEGDIVDRDTKKKILKIDDDYE